EVSRVLPRRPERQAYSCRQQPDWNDGNQVQYTADGSKILWPTPHSGHLEDPVRFQIKRYGEGHSRPENRERHDQETCGPDEYALLTPRMIRSVRGRAGSFQDQAGEGKADSQIKTENQPMLPAARERSYAKLRYGVSGTAPESPPWRSWS